MAILGTLIDKQTISRAAVTGAAGVTLATLSHSLPATNPEMVLPILRSIQDISIAPNVGLMGLGGNASLLTIGYAVGSSATCGTLLADVYAQVFHSIIR
jgi:hypothetical protein